MIVGYISDPVVRAALASTAHPEEDVILDPALADEAVAFGFPRLIVRLGEGAGTVLPPVYEAGVPVLTLPWETPSRWEVEWRSQGLPAGRARWTADRLRALVEQEARADSWVDRALGDLGRAVGSPLPSALKGFARRVMEFPSHYDDLHPLAEACGTSRGALKARFRRRNLPSPYSYLRWFRVMAVAHCLSDREATVAQVASRLGYTSDGNLCRALQSLTHITPTEARTPRGWNLLIINLAWKYLDGEALKAWREMGDLFVARVA